MPNVSGLPEDDFVTDWSFKAAGTGDSFLDGITDSIISFFNTANTTNDVNFYLSSVVSRVASAASFEAYDLTGALDGSPHGSPFYVRSWTVDTPPSSAEEFPNEVALVSTLWASGYADVPESQANPSPPPPVIRPRARYRGRIYLGPLNDATAGSAPVSGDLRPGAVFLTDMSDAWFRFMDERGGDFAVWSRADEVLRLVAPDGRITMDDAYDTQRRRGAARTTRTQLWP